VEWESSDEVLRKCPTTLEYELNENLNQFSLKACGMNCAHRYPSLKGKAIRDQPIRYVEWFKLFLEPAYLKTAIEKRIPWAPTSQDEIVAIMQSGSRLIQTSQMDSTWIQTS